MDENAIRQWLIDCFGPIQGEMAWNQLQHAGSRTRPADESGSEHAPKPEEVKSMMQAFTAGGLQHHGRYAAGRDRGRSTSNWRNRSRCSRRMVPDRTAA